MNIEQYSFKVGDLEVEVIKKNIKNLHIGVCPPEGKVRVAAPSHMADEAIKLAVLTRLGWIMRKKNLFMKQARESIRNMVNGESHYFQGKRYRLEIFERDRPPTIFLKNKKKMILIIRPNTSTEKRRDILNHWYRFHLRTLVTPMIKKWEQVLGVDVNEWGVRRMKVKWGSCNPETKRILINLELAKKPVECLEYIVVHEMIHLLERHHNERFFYLMNKYLPSWEVLRDRLNSLPLVYVKDGLQGGI